MHAIAGVRFGGIRWWPGDGVARKQGFAGAVVLSLAWFSAAGATNDWTKATSGNWEEGYWSLGQLPGMDQELVAFRNAGWKALAIGVTTAASYPASLSLNNLVIDAPSDSFNQLILNWAGPGVPLFVDSNLTIGTHGSLASHYSALHAANAYIDGTASFSDYSTEEFGQLSLRSEGTLNLTNGTMTSSNLTFYTGTFTQSGGTHRVQIINNGTGDLIQFRTAGAYYLQGGILISQNLDLGAGGGYGPEGHGLLQQTGGVHTNTSMGLGGWVHHSGNITLGSYELDGGLLVSSSVGVYGSFSQNGGTNLIQELQVGEGGNFRLSGGELVTSNVSVSRDPYVGNLGFYQSGGVHTVLGRLLVEGSDFMDYGHPPYELAGGTLVTANIEIDGGALCISSNGIVSNSGILTLSGGDVAGNDATETQYLGQLQVYGGNLDVHRGYGYSQPTVWRFADSHTLPWSGPLHVWYWGVVPGDHIFFGTNAQALTAAQVDQVEFMAYGTNGITSFPGILLSTGELVPVTATNEWTKPDSGYWEESYWSLSRLPGMDQGFVLFDNPGRKTLTIGENTTANYSDSLSLHNLLVDGPTNSANQLLLNWAGLSVPLNAHQNLTVGPNGALVSHYSAIHAANAYIDGSVWLEYSSIADLNRIWLRPGGSLTFSSGFLTSANLSLDGATLSQSGGTHIAQNITLPVYDYLDYYDGVSPPSSYYLQGGVLVSQALLLDSTRDESGGTTFGTFLQSGGVHTNSGLTLYNRSSSNAKGTYILNGGLLVSAYVYPYGGSFAQHGGTNIIGELVEEGDFTLDGGQLVSSNATVYFSTFLQSGGTHIVSSNLVIGIGYEYEGGTSTYDLTGGNLVTSNIDIDTGTLRISSHGSVSNAGILTFSSYFPGAIRANNADGIQHLGKLQMSYGGTLDMHSSAGQPTNATVFRFSDSHSLPWAGSLVITNWGLNPGDHIYFGTNAQGLTATQLAQVQFWGNKTNYPAKILATGEIVPAAVPQSILASRIGNALVLSWPGDGYGLDTATNVNGPYLPVPGAASPFTNTFADPQRFFRLHLASP